MRSVKIDRKASQPRSPRAGRGTARASRAQPSGKPFGKRNDIVFSGRRGFARHRRDEGVEIAAALRRLRCAASQAAQQRGAKEKSQTKSLHVQKSLFFSA